MSDLRERVAELLWHRFAPEHHMEWENETHAEEYRDVADAALTVALEEAARVADDEACHCEDTGSPPSDFGNAGRNDAARYIAAAIRALIPKA